MLDLEPGVHLQEVKVLLPVHEELDRPRALVSHLPHQALDLPYHLPPRLGPQHRARTLLDDLLVPPLYAALPLGEAEDVELARGGIPAGQDLYLDVVGVLDVLLDEEAVVAEEGPGLGPAEAVALDDLLVLVSDG